MASKKKRKQGAGSRDPLQGRGKLEAGRMEGGGRKGARPISRED